MSAQLQINLRTRKLGVLMRDARLSARKTEAEVANAMGISPELLNSYEQGEKAPSLPELEVFAYHLNIPIQHFWGTESLSAGAARTSPINLPQLVSLRQRIIGALLQQRRLHASISVKALSSDTGIPQEQLTAYEQGAAPIPLPELEAILTVLGGRVETFFDQNGPIGKWMSEQAAVREFLNLPPELREFVCLPVNRPYLELARNLSQLSTERLRAVAESLLDITL